MIIKVTLKGATKQIFYPKIYVSVLVRASFDGLDFIIAVKSVNNYILFSFSDQKAASRRSAVNIVTDEKIDAVAPLFELNA